MAGWISDAVLLESNHVEPTAATILKQGAACLLDQLVFDRVALDHVQRHVILLRRIHK
jgi:hypothetical protein